MEPSQNPSGVVTFSPYAQAVASGLWYSVKSRIGNSGHAVIRGFGPKVLPAIVHRPNVAEFGAKHLPLKR